MSDELKNNIVETIIDDGIDVMSESKSAKVIESISPTSKSTGDLVYIDGVELKNELDIIDENASNIRNRYKLPKRRVQIRPIDVVKWHKKRGLNSFTRPKKFGPLYDSNFSGYATGLTSEEEAFLTELTGFDLTKQFSAEKAHPYWGGPGRVSLPNQTKILSLENVQDYIIYKYIKFSPFVANSLAEYDEGKWAEAIFYISDAEAEVAIEAVKIGKKQELHKYLFECSPNKKRRILEIALGKSTLNKSDEFVGVEIYKFFDSKPNEALMFIQMEATTIANHSMVVRAINYGILQNRQGGIYYKEAKLGITIQDVVNFIKQGKNQDVMLTVKELVSRKENE